MYRGLLMMTLVRAILGAAIAPKQEFSTERVRQLELVDTPSGAENSLAMYAAPSHSALPAHFHPKYQDHWEKHAPQSGYDKFLIPVPPPRFNWGSSIFTALGPLSSYAISYGTRLGVYIWNEFVLPLIGSVLTTFVCAFTPFCTILFPGLRINKNQVREQVSELPLTYMTPESMVNAATLFVKKAIEKYADLERQQQEEEEQRKANNKNEKNDKKRRRR